MKGQIITSKKNYVQPNYYYKQIPEICFFEYKGVFSYFNTYNALKL